MEKEQPSALLLARRTRTMKLCSSDARSRGQLGCSVEKWQKRESTRWTRTVEGNPVHPLNVAWHLYSMELAQKSDEEILQIADPIMDNLMQASTEINHERHVRDFTERLKSLVTKDYLEKVCLLRDRLSHMIDDGQVSGARLGRRLDNDIQHIRIIKGIQRRTHHPAVQ